MPSCQKPPTGNPIQSAQPSAPFLEKKLGLNVVTEHAGSEKVYRLIEAPQSDAPDYTSTHVTPKPKEFTKGPLVQNQKSTNYTIAHMIQDYISHYSKEGKGVSGAYHMINAHILPSLGKLSIDQLTTKIIADWHYSLTIAPIRNRLPKPPDEETAVDDHNDPEFIRRRRASANRILTILKAALNYAWRSSKIDSDLAWRRVQPFRSVAAPIIRYLTEEECKRLVKACDPDLRLIVQAGLFTGCRYGEIGRLVNSDYQADSGTIYVKISKSGKPRHIALTSEGKEFFTKITRGKPSTDLMFRTSNGDSWGRSFQSRRMRAACEKANIEPPVSYHILRHTYGSLLAMKGAPMAVVAKQLGHATTQITEKHYAHISQSYVAQVVRESFPPLKIAD